MTRIQNILEKAEREGAVRRVRPDVAVDSTPEPMTVLKGAGSHRVVSAANIITAVCNVALSVAMTLLLQKGARVSYSDPFVPTLPARAWHGGQDLASVALDPATLADVDCVAILTDHSAIDYTWLAAAAPLVVDSRNAVKERHPHVFRLGAPAAADTAVAGANRGEEAA